MTSTEEQPGDITLKYQFESAGEEVTINVSGWYDPLIALSALRTAGSDESLNNIFEQLREQAEQ